MSLLCHFLIYSKTYIFVDLVLNEVGLPLISQPKREFRKWWLWSLVACVNMPSLKFKIGKLMALPMV